MQINPLTKNIAKPTARSFNDSPLCESQPESKTNGIISRDGREVSICTSSCDAEGNIRLKSSKMGDTANPGNEVTADTDQIASSASRDISPFPVEIFIAIDIYNICIAECKLSAKKKSEEKLFTLNFNRLTIYYFLTQRIWKPFARLCGALATNLLIVRVVVRSK